MIWTPRWKLQELHIIKRTGCSLVYLTQYLGCHLSSVGFLGPVSLLPNCRVLCNRATWQPCPGLQREAKHVEQMQVFGVILQLGQYFSDSPRSIGAYLIFIWLWTCEGNALTNPEFSNRQAV
jgi:hypothetical protein